MEVVALAFVVKVMTSVWCLHFLETTYQLNSAASHPELSNDEV